MSGKTRVFTLTQEGVEAKELTTAIDGKRKTFVFPYPTSDEREIEYLLSKGATAKAPSPFRKTNVPLRGGEQQ